MSEYTLLTGSTGLLGRYLLRDLLSSGQRVAAVVRPSKAGSGRERVDAILRGWEEEDGSLLPRPVCLEGDVSRPGLGLDSGGRAWVSEHCRSVIHSAAVLTFDNNDANGEPWHTNVGGTKHVLELCEATNTRQLHYVSTAYVCGLREGLVLESELDCGQEFRNAYEKSKLAAEKLVRSARCLDRLTVYRPAVIAGDSVTGYTNTYHGLYLYLKLMSVLVWNTKAGPDGVRYTPVRLQMTGDEPRNIVPVDWVAAVIGHLFRSPSAHGHTFHLTPAQPITPREIIEAGYTYFNSRGVEFCGSAGTDERISSMDQLAHDNMGIYKAYEVSDPQFDASNLQKFAPDMPCPTLDEPMLHRFWKYGEWDNWGKRKEQAGELKVDAAAILHDLGGRLNGSQRFATAIGLDVVGPGGGQWSLSPNRDGLLTLEMGIRGRGTPVVRLSASDLRERVGNADDDFLEWLQAMATPQTDRVRRASLQNAQ